LRWTGHSRTAISCGHDRAECDNKKKVNNNNKDKRIKKDNKKKEEQKDNDEEDACFWCLRYDWNKETKRGLDSTSLG
jgi:hypothetical protein